MKKEQEKTPRKITENDINAAIKVPAPLSNVYLIFMGPATARITFGEGTPSSDEIHYHTAVSLSLEDARKLQQTLLNMLEEREEEENTAGNKGGKYIFGGRNSKPH